MRFGGDLGHHVDVERLDDLLVKPRFVGFERLDQQQRGGRLDGAVKVDADIDAVAVLLAQGGKALDDLVDKERGFDVFERFAAALAGRPSWR